MKIKKVSVSLWDALEGRISPGSPTALDHQTRNKLLSCLFAGLYYCSEFLLLTDKMNSTNIECMDNSKNIFCFKQLFPH